jgi:hypothetical protein
MLLNKDKQQKIAASRQMLLACWRGVMRHYPH